MTIQFANHTQIAQWNAMILANPDKGNVFQSVEFAQQKERGGWTPRYITLPDLALTILEKDITGLGKLWYIPKGPGITSVRQLQEMLPNLTTFGRTNHVFAIKIEPEIQDSEEVRIQFTNLGLHRVNPIQPNFSTVTLDLSGTDDEILSRLHQKGRHAIRRAERDGVTIELVDSSDTNCQLMYKLLSSTAKDSFRIRSYNYYKQFWQRFSATGSGQLFFASVNGAVVAGAYAISFGTKSTYKDGASVKERTVYGASHLLQWHVILWAKKKGSLMHDFCGSPPSTEIKNEQHPHYGIGRFKTSFNKEVTDYIGAYDIIVRPNAYRLWQKIGERVVLSWHSRRHHESWY